MRIRTIKPEFWTSLTVGELDYACKLQFIGLWNYADDEGRGVDDPRLIKAAIWPLDHDMNVDAVDSAMGVLEASGLLTRYEVGGLRYFSLNSWGEHQAISKPRPSKLPAPSSREGKGKEQGKERKGRESGQAALAAALLDNDARAQHLLRTLVGEDPGWMAVTNGALMKLGQTYGADIVTTALGFMREEFPAAIGKPYAYLESVCLRIQSERGAA